MRRIRFGTVLVAVVLSLTGFSRSHHGHTSSHGGGCSSSHSSSTTHRHYNDNDNDYGSSTGSTSGSTSSTRYTAGPTPSATGQARAAVVTCVKKGRTSATVKVIAASGSGTHNYTVTVSFLAADGSHVDGGSADVQVYSGSSATLKVPMETPSKVSSVTRCAVQSVSLRY